jgi:hypothetical protein
MRRLANSLWLALGLAASPAAAGAESAVELPALPKVGTIVRLRITVERGQTPYQFEQSQTVVAVENATYTGERRTDDLGGAAGRIAVEAATETLDRNPFVGLRRQEIHAGTAAAQVARFEISQLEGSPIFPLSIGKAWASVTRTDTYLKDGKRVEGRPFTQSCTVRAAERLTVAAGTFDVLRIECEGFEAGFSTQLTTYYAPAIGRGVKTVTMSSSYNKAGPRVTTELLGIEVPPR